MLVRLHLRNSVSEQAMRDGIVDPGVHSNYTNKIIHFAPWVRMDHEKWFTDYGLESPYDALDEENENEGLRTRQKRVKAGLWLALLSNARNVPIFNVDAFNATAVMSYISRQVNQHAGRPLSREGYGTK